MAGRPLLIESPDKFWDLFIEYRIWCKQNPFKVHDFVGKDATEVFRCRERPLTISGFSAWLYDKGVINDVRHYFKNTDGAYDEFLPVTTRVKQIIESDQIDGGMSGVYNANLTARINGITEKVEQTNIGDGLKVEIVSK